MNPDPQITNLSLLSKRATAAVVDMAGVGSLCFGMQWAMRLVDPPRRMPAAICAGLLGALVMIEALSGWTIGKSVAHLSVRSAARGRSVAQGRVRLHASILRAVVRELPVAVFIPSLFAQDGLISLLIWGISLTMVCCYIAAAYLAVARVGRTPFDLAAKTIVVIRETESTV